MAKAFFRLKTEVYDQRRGNKEHRTQALKWALEQRDIEVAQKLYNLGVDESRLPGMAGPAMQAEHEDLVTDIIEGIKTISGKARDKAETAAIGSLITAAVTSDNGSSFDEIMRYTLETAKELLGWEESPEDPGCQKQFRDYLNAHNINPVSRAIRADQPLGTALYILNKLVQEYGFPFDDSQRRAWTARKAGDQSLSLQNDG